MAQVDRIQNNFLLAVNVIYIHFYKGH